MTFLGLGTNLILKKTFLEKQMKIIFLFFLVFTKDFPARCTVQVAKIGLDARVEIEVVAVTGDVKYTSN